MTPSELVGHQIVEARRRRGMSQTDLGQALKPYLGKAWAKQTVASVEAGTRELSVPELLAIALVFVLPVHWFFGGDEEEGVTFAGGERVKGLGMVLLVMEHLPPLETADAATAFVEQTADREAEIIRLLEVALTAVQTNVRVLRHLTQGKPALRVTSRVTQEGTDEPPRRRSRRKGEGSSGDEA
jgi:transcriptional regulator with XRE-family HTH domain